MTNSVPATHERISKLDAIALIAERVKIPSESLRATQDKVRKRIDYAIRKGALPDPGPSGFVFGEFIGWAMGQRGWGRALDGIPAIIVGHADLVLPGITFSARGLSLPSSLGGCHAALVAADATIAELESRIATLEAAVCRLQVFEIRLKKMSTGGKRGGRGNTL
jgi:hypothetical protein